MNPELYLKLALVAWAAWKDQRAQWKAAHPDTPEPPEWTDAEAFIKADAAADRLIAVSNGLKAEFSARV